MRAFVHSRRQSTALDVEHLQLVPAFARYFTFELWRASSTFARSFASELDRFPGRRHRIRSARWASRVRGKGFSTQPVRSHTVELFFQPATGMTAESLTDIISRFLDNACPDHHVRGGTITSPPSTRRCGCLARYPEIATANFYTRVVCGDLDAVQRRRLWDRRPMVPRNESRGRANDIEML